MIPQWAATARTLDGRHALSFATPWLLISLSQKKLTLSLMLLLRSDAGLSLAVGLPWEKTHIDRTDKRTRYVLWLVALTVWRDNGSNLSSAPSAVKP